MPYSWQGGTFQGHKLHADFELKNLSGDIKRNRDRLEALRRAAGPRAAAAPSPSEPVDLDWVASPEVSGLQGSMPISGEGTQLGLFRQHHRARVRRSRRT